jgi:transcriptional regulator GlxA family with amidase domain
MTPMPMSAAPWAWAMVATLLVTSIPTGSKSSREAKSNPLRWLRRIHLAGADVASACTGAFLLAEAGILDGKAATTDYRSRYGTRTAPALVKQRRRTG